MTETELIRQQIDAATYYLNKLHNDYKLDRKSCRFFSNLLAKRKASYSSIV